MKSLSISISDWKYLIAIVLPAICFIGLFPNFLERDTFFWICIVTIPISIIKGNRNFPFFTLVISFGLITILFPTVIGTYLTVCCAILFFLQLWKGGIHIIGLIHLFLASPFFIYTSTLVSFPIRIWLTQVVSFLLGISGIENKANGNIIEMGDLTFLVDSACAGLHLLSYGILFGTIILALHIRSKNMSGWKMINLYLLLVLLIIWGNIVRIYLLVALDIREDNWMHYGLGLAIFVFQVLLPFYFLVERFNNNQSSENSFQASVKFPALHSIVSSLLILLVFLRTNIYLEAKQNFQLVNKENIGIEMVRDDVAKMYDGKVLTYIKSPVAPYRANHNPMICWSGSGFAFGHVFKEYILGIGEVNMAKLSKGKDRMYTAWWFESAQGRTANQWSWRWRNIQNGERFYLVNVTSNSQDILIEQLKKMRDSKVISNLITSR